MKFLIIEDEHLSAKHIGHLLKKIHESNEVIAILDSVKSALDFFSNPQPFDIIIADINLSDGVSFDIFNKVEIKLPVIFTTAYDEYAIRAFKLNSIDYLLKPVGIEDLQLAVYKAQVAKKDNPKGLPLLDIKFVLNKDYKRRFLVKGSEGPLSVMENEIACFVEQAQHLTLVKSDGRQFNVEFTIDNLTPLLDPTLFFRINKSVLIHISAIEQVRPDVNGQLRINSNFLKLNESHVNREHVADFKIWWAS